MNLFVEFINQYGMAILYTVLTSLAGYLGIAIKGIYQRFMEDKTKKSVAKIAAGAIEQMYKDYKGEERLAEALQAAEEMLALKGIVVSSLELRLLIEDAVFEFNKEIRKK